MSEPIHPAASHETNAKAMPEFVSRPPREFSGSKLVVGMFLFAAMMSSGLWVYWYFHTLPFQPLQVAIARAFPKSYPLVQGGQRRIHRDTPKVLRVTLRVDFDPASDESDPRVDDLVTRLAELAKQHLDFASYQLFEVHLVQMRPEHAARSQTLTREVRDFERPAVEANGT
jgi:hypothetical protein